MAVQLLNCRRNGHPLQDQGRNGETYQPTDQRSNPETRLTARAGGEQSLTAASVFIPPGAQPFVWHQLRSRAPGGPQIKTLETEKFEIDLGTSHNQNKWEVVNMGLNRTRRAVHEFHVVVV